MPPSKPAPYPSKARSHFSRSRNGCLTCRSRRKKCDEVKPICGSCDVGKRSCKWPPPSRPNQFHDGVSSTSSLEPQNASSKFPNSTTDQPNRPGDSEPTTLPPLPGATPANSSLRPVSNASELHEKPTAVPPTTRATFSEPVLIHDPAPSTPRDLQPPRVPKTPPPMPGIIPVRVSRRPPEAPPMTMSTNYPSSSPDPNLISHPFSASGPLVQSSPPVEMKPHRQVFQVEPHHSPNTYPSMAEYPAGYSSSQIPAVPAVDMSYIPTSQQVSPEAPFIPHVDQASINIVNPSSPVVVLTESNMGISQATSMPGLVTSMAPASLTSPVSLSNTADSSIASSSPVAFYPPSNIIEPNVSGMPNSGISRTLPAVNPPDQYDGYTNYDSQLEIINEDYEASQNTHPLSTTGLLGSSFDNSQHQGFIGNLEDSKYSLPQHSEIQAPHGFRSHNAPPPGARPPTPIMMTGYVHVSENGVISPILGHFTDEAESPHAPETVFSELIEQKIRTGEAGSGGDDPADNEHTMTSLELSSLRMRKLHHKNKKSKTQEMAMQHTFSGHRKRILTNTERITRAIQIGSVQRTLYFTDSTDLDPRSHLLFKHYLDTVADQLVTCDESINPFRRHVLPLATKDDILLHAILAAGGAYFCFEDSVNPALGEVSQKHYTTVLSRLHPALRAGRYTSATDRVFLVAIMMLLSLFETLAGRTYGSILMHLMACRTTLLTLLEDPPKDKHSEIGVVFGFVCECYCYTGTMAALSSLLCYGAPKIPIDDFMRDLSFLKDYPTCRGFLGIGHSLWEIIPDIVDLGKDRFEEEERGDASIEVFARYRNLLRQVESWTDPDDHGDMRMDWRNASAVYQHTLIIVLHNLYYNDLYSQEEVIADVRLRVEMAFPLLLSVALSSNVGMMMLFPCMVLASCTEEEWLKGTFRYGIMAAKFKSCSMKQALLVLERLWTDDSREAFGPRGLGYIMKKHGVVFTMT
ncbi:hypothetical protein BROUX41_000572 [Berkeleyomyces rouxiae]